MDDVTNTMNTAAAAEPQQPAVRVRVVDAATRQTMNQMTEVVFVPCPDSEPIKIKNKALEQLPARRYVIKATAPSVCAVFRSGENSSANRMLMQYAARRQLEQKLERTWNTRASA